MLDLIVLGQIPGTNIQLGFAPVLIFFGLGGVVYILRKYHLAKLKTVTKKLSAHKKQLIKQLVHFRDDVLGPKLKFLK